MPSAPSDTAVRVALVCASYGAGGLEKHIIDLAGALANEGAAVSVIAHPSYAARLPAGITFLPWNPDGPRWLPWRRMALKKLLRQAAPEVIHAHGDKAADLVAALAPSAVPAATLVATCHNHRRKTRAYAGFHQVIAVSRALATTLRHPRVKVIYHGLAPAAPVSPAVAFPTDGTPLALAVGRLVPQKGFDLLLDAWQTVPARLMIAGDGPDRAALERFIADKGLGARVKLLGHRDDVPALLAACDFFILSSRHEAYGYVLAEALLADRPVVATQAGGLDEILPHAVKPGDVAALAEAAREAASNPVQLRGKQADLFKFAREHLTLASMAQATLRAYAAGAGHKA